MARITTYIKPRKVGARVATRTNAPAFGTRPIRSEFFEGARRNRNPVKVNRGRWALTAVPNAVMHMQLDTYGARLCEVWDERTGELYAQVRRKVTGELEIVFMKQPEEGY